MSASLGPIHYWLYRKIQFQEGLVQKILETSREHAWDAAIEGKVNSTCGEAVLLPLDEIIDHRNIHGWLQQKIGIVEMRFAVLVTELMKQDLARLSELKNTAYRFGQDYPIANDSGAADAFRTLGDLLLDGMPCDRVNMVVEQNEDSIVWNQTQCVHQEYWEQARGEASHYYVLREELIRGMLFNSGLEFNAQDGGLFEIRREEA